MLVIIRHYLNFFFHEWQKPLMVVGIGFLVFAVGGLTHSHFWELICFYTFCFTLLILAVSLVYQIAKRRKDAAVYTALAFVGVFIALFCYSIFLFMIDTIYPEDGYADNLKIPSNIEIHETKSMQFHETGPSDSLRYRPMRQQDLEIYQSFQSGIYEYDICLGKVEKGTVHLKAYEVTQNDPLSVKDLLERSSIKVYNPVDSIVRFQSNGDFTIYEGDWGKPYVVRFEVWFQPDARNEKRKLLEKNYKVEGWMR